MPKQQEKTIRNKQRLIRLFKYLYRETDEDHPVTTNELVEIFTEANANAARKTVKDDIDVLVEEGYDIVTIKSYYNAFFMASREFELPELKLLIDAVSSSRFISKAKCYKMSSRNVQKILNKNVQFNSSRIFLDDVLQAV